MSLDTGLFFLYNREVIGGGFELPNQNAPYGRVNTSYDRTDGAGFLPSTPMPSDTKKEILKVSGILGVSLLLFLSLSEVASALVLKLVNSGVLPYTFVMKQVIQILYSLLTILVPFGIGAYFIKKVQKKDTLLLLGKPKSGVRFAEALGIGCMAIIVANFATALFVQVCNSHGITFDTYEPDTPSSPAQFAWVFLSNAVVPALAEEFAIRGVLLQSLRKYGDAFAVFASALLFGIMHGNMTQAPFAFLLGAVLAYLVIVTGSLWTAMAIHLINNTYSVAMTALYNGDNNLLTAMVTVSVSTLAMIYGIISLIYFFGLHHGKETYRSRYMPGGPSKEGIRTWRRQAWLYTIISPTTAVALILLLVSLFRSVHFTG